MAVDDYLDSEVGIAIAATAALLSPKARRVLRRGLVYGAAGVLAAGEALASAGRRVGEVASEVAVSGEAASTEEPASGEARRKTRTAETPA